MASVIQASFAAVAFPGAGYLFKIFDKSGYEREQKRHDLAVEQLEKQKEQFYDEEIRRNDKMQELRQKLNDGNIDINKTNDSLDQYRKVMELQKQLKIRREPQLSDYYKPSNEMKRIPIFIYKYNRCSWRFITFCSDLKGLKK